jgi:hypothetical protein
MSKSMSESTQHTYDREVRGVNNVRSEGTGDSAALASLEAQARALGIMEARPLFGKTYAPTRRPVDHSTVDYHWNELAHEKVAGAVTCLWRYSSPGCTAKAADQSRT